MLQVAMNHCKGVSDYIPKFKNVGCKAKGRDLKDDTGSLNFFKPPGAPWSSENRFVGPKRARVIPRKTFSQMMGCLIEPNVSTDIDNLTSESQL